MSQRRSRTDHAADMKHLVDEIFGAEGNPNYPTAVAFKRAGIVRGSDLMAIRQEDLEKLTYPVKQKDNSTTMELLPLAQRARVQSFQRWIKYKSIVEGNRVRETDWQSLTSPEFEDFIIGPNNSDKAAYLSGTNCTCSYNYHFSPT